jgi:hypothetical protein
MVNIKAYQCNKVMCNTTVLSLLAAAVAAAAAPGVLQIKGLYRGGP